MIEVKDLSFSYDGRNEIVSDVSFIVEKGTVLSVLGNNGAGKSTMITCLNGIRKPSKGNVFIDDIDILSLPNREIAKRVAYCAQAPDRLSLTVFDSVLLGRKPYITFNVDSSDLDVVHAMLERVGISDLSLRSLNEISGGERQKAMLARALVQEPELLLLDEPTSALDPKAQQDIMALVREIAIESNIAVIAVLHDLNLAARYSDSFLFLKDHHVYAFGSSSVLTEENIKAVYDLDVDLIEHKGVRVIIPRL